MRQLLQLVTFLAFAIQAWIPAGFMPDANAHTMVVCHGIAQTADIVANHKVPVPTSHAEKCPYAGVAVYSDVPPSPVFIIISVPYIVSLALPDTRMESSLVLLSARPRGPPGFFS